MKKIIGALLLFVVLVPIAYATITTSEVYLLNHWGTVGRQTQLGTLIQNAESVTAGEIALTDTYLVVGNGSNVGAGVALSGDATIANTGALTLSADSVGASQIETGAVGTAEIAADAVTNAKIADGAVGLENIDRSQMIFNFEGLSGAFSGPGNGGVAGAGQGDVNAIEVRGHHFEWFNTVAQTIGVNWVTGKGFNLAGDQTQDDALEFGTGATASDVSKVVDTDNFYFRAKLELTTGNGIDGMYVGLRKAMAYGTTLGNYDDYYAVAINTKAAAALLKVVSNLADGGEAEVNTTQDIADGEYMDIKIYIGDEARLQTAIDLTADLKSVFNTHYADQGAGGEEHISADTAIALAAPTTTATLILAVSELQDSYAAHEADAQLGASWVFHQVDNDDDDSLISDTNPTTLAECVTVLNDIKAKFALHIANASAHTAGDNSGASAIDASSTWLQLGENGALADPTAALAFDFDTDEVIVPYIYVLQSDVQSAGFYLHNFEVVDVTTN